MPDLIPEQLNKEINIAGRAIPLFVPVIGIGIAVLLVLVVKLRGKSGGGSEQEPAAASGGEASTGQFESAIGALQGSIASVQGNIAEQISGVQAGVSQQVGTLQGQIAEVQAGTTQQISALQGLLSGATAEQQAALASVQAGTAQQISAFQGLLSGATAEQQAALKAQGEIFSSQIELQSQALQSGLSGVATQAQQFKQDILARQSALENRVLAIETSGAKVNKQNRFAVAQAVSQLARYLDETRAGATQRLQDIAIEGGTGNVKLGTGYILQWAGA